MQNHYLERLESFLKSSIKNHPIPDDKIRQAINYALFPGGKRLRALLVYHCGHLLQLQTGCVDVIAAAIEITHCYSLIHDDLPAMDNDDFRRGKPSCHKAFDEATAILTGDGMQVLAIELLLEKLPAYLSDRQTLEVTRALISACGVSGMVSGQSLDLAQTSEQNISEAQLIQIHRLKTGCLIEACIQMVLIASQCSTEQKNALENFASTLGLVFQMQDDYLDQYADEQVLGKGRKSDQANQKSTFASIHSQKALLQLIDEYYDKTLTALSCFEERAEALKELVLSLRKRG